MKKQRHRALMLRIGRIMMEPFMEGRHRRHELNQQKDAHAKNTGAAFHSAHEPSSRRSHHGGEYAPSARRCNNIFEKGHSASDYSRSPLFPIESENTGEMKPQINTDQHRLTQMKKENA